MFAFQHRLQAFMAEKFGNLGHLAARHPWRLILFGAVLSILLSLGNLTLEFESESSELWVPRRNGPYLDRELIRETFEGGASRSAVVMASSVNSANILSRDHFLALLDVHNAVVALTVKHGGKVYAWKDICVRAYFSDDAPCASDRANPLIIWNFDRATIEALSDADVRAAITQFHQTVSSAESFVGGVKTDSGNAVVSGSSVLLNYAIRDVPQVDEEVLLDWEKQFIDSMSDANEGGKVDGNLLRLDRLTRRSFNDEIVRLVTGDMPLFLFSFVIILMYLMFTLGRALDKLESKFWVGSMALIVILLANSAAFGLASIFTIPINSICILVPFVVLGVGVDDLIILVDSVGRYSRKMDLAERLQFALANSGTAITLTSLTAVFAFAVGATTDLPGVQSFSAVAAFAFLTKYILGMIMFPAFISLDEKRIEAKKNAFLPCMKVADQSDSTEEPAVSDETVDSNGNAKVIPPHIGPTDKFFALYVAPNLAKKSVALGVVLFFLAIGSTSAYLWANKLEVGLPDRHILPDGSYVIDMLDGLEAEFDARLAPVLLYMEDVDWTKQEDVTRVDRLVNEIEAQPWAFRPASAFYREFDAFLLDQSQQLSNITLAQYKSQLQTFLTLPQYQRFTADLKIVDGLIKAAQVDFTFKDPPESPERIEIIDKIKATYAENDIKGFGFSLTFMFAHTDDTISQTTMINIIIALVAIFVTLLFFISPWMALLITFNVLLIDADIIGLMVLWDVNLNSVSFVCLVMALGLSVDYNVHLGHAYLHHSGTPTERVMKALCVMGTSVFKGGLTTFLGVLVVSGTSSVAFRTFFKLLFATVLFGMLHGLVFLPAVLTLLGIQPSEDEDEAAGEHDLPVFELVPVLKKAHDLEVAGANASSS